MFGFPPHIDIKTELELMEKVDGFMYEIHQQVQKWSFEAKRTQPVSSYVGVGYVH
jgi:hypothetical protein